MEMDKAGYSDYLGGDGSGGGGGGFNGSEMMGSYPSNLSSLPGVASGSIISNIPCNQKKVDALRSIQDPMRAFQKVSISYIAHSFFSWENGVLSTAEPVYTYIVF